MGLYGDYRIGSDGWDDGYERVRDSGDDASAYHIMYTEHEPDDGHEADEPASVESGGHIILPLDDDELAERRWRMGTAERRQLVKQEWERCWFELTSDQSERFLRRRDLTDLVGYPRWLVMSAVHRNQKLAEALSFAQSVVKNTNRGRARSSRFS